MWVSVGWGCCGGGEGGGLVGVLSEPLIALIFVMGCDWALVDARFGGDGGEVVRVAGPAPPRALTPTLSHPTGEGECLWRMRLLRR